MHKMPSWKRIEQRKSPGDFHLHCLHQSALGVIQGAVLRKSTTETSALLTSNWSRFLKLHDHQIPLASKTKASFARFFELLCKNPLSVEIFFTEKSRDFCWKSVLQCFAHCDCSSSDLQVLASSDFSPKRLAIPGIPNSSVFIFKRGGFRNFSKVWWSTNLKNVEWRVNSLKETPFGVLSTSDLRHDQGQHTLVLKQKGLGTTFYCIL